MPERGMITEPDVFFDRGCGRCDRFGTDDCATRLWRAGLLTLRRICLAAGLTEVAKWGHPVYMHAGRNIAIIGAFRGDFRLTFFNAGLMRDPDAVLERQGPNSRTPDCIRFAEDDGPARREALILAYLDEAKGYAGLGVLPPKEPVKPDLPAELIEALDLDAELERAFAALTPGRQKSWVLFLLGAKTAATRMQRIDRGKARIVAGKGATER